MANDFDIAYYLKLENKESKVTMLADYLIEFAETDLETDYGKMTEENFIKFYFDNVQKIMSYYYEKYDWTIDEMIEFNRVKETKSFKRINIETALKFSKFVFYDDFHFMQYPEKYCDLHYEKTKIGYKVFEVFRDWVLRKNNPIKINTAKVKYLRELGMFEKFSEKKTQKIISLLFCEKPNPYKIALLYEIGFYKLEKIKKLPSEKKQNEELRKIVEIHIDSIRRNRANLSEPLNPPNDITKYTAHYYTAEIRKELQKIT